MNIHEYQAKDLLRGYGVPLLKGQLATTVSDAVAAANILGGPVWVVKAQIHAGGRGKGGGVKVVKTIEDVEAAARAILGMQLITHQTGPEGKLVQRLYVEEGCAIARELYLGLLIDRTSGWPTFIVSTEGGMDIEEVAAHTPEKIVKIAIDPATGCQPYHGRKAAFAWGLNGKQINESVALLQNLYRAFMELDLGLLEINPLVVTADGHLVALDAKVSLDENALYRHADLAELRDETEENPAEREASRHELNYVKLDGSVGCMVNGAGLAMATMDIVKLYGCEPANFLDVGGGATRERVTTAFKLILSDKDVKGILVNIFGGIMRCDIIAQGIIEAAREVQLHLPLVVRLAGTNVDLGRTMLAESGLPIITASDLADAAQKIVSAVQGGAA